MTTKKIAKYEQELSELSKSLNELRMIQDSSKKYPDLKNLYQLAQTLAAKVTAPLSNANILNTDIKVGLHYSVALESQIGELINNIHNTLQTKMMLNACVFAKRSCFWAAVAAIVACISIILTVCLN